MTDQREGPLRVVLYRCDGCRHLRLDHYAWGVHACCAWGEPSNSRLKRLVRERVAQVVELLKGRELYALAVTKSGAPRHPLYLRADSELKEWPVRP